ncbi:hypothetical protein GQ44DRAFT_698136 [Phaeosphaeriaceae sp. PMI808]|nr:hypothetical protein GQ44DRAFT_698136 [Phaeosphaeriaceae sp. PMI808]
MSWHLPSYVTVNNYTMLYYPFTITQVNCWHLCPQEHPIVTSITPHANGIQSYIISTFPPLSSFSMPSPLTLYAQPPHNHKNNIQAKHPPTPNFFLHPNKLKLKPKHQQPNPSLKWPQNATRTSPTLSPQNSSPASTLHHRALTACSKRKPRSKGGMATSVKSVEKGL